MLLEILALLGLKGVAGIGRAVDDAKTKKNSACIDSNGNVCSVGRTGKYYVNGEETYSWAQDDKYGNRHNMTIGVNSGKVYHDSFDDEVRMRSQSDEIEKQRMLKRGYLAYNKYDFRFRQPVTTEISTGKVIAALCIEYTEDHHAGGYYKFYYKERTPHSSCDFDKSAIGDYGIKITKEEYDKLNIPYSTSNCLPSDPNVANKLLRTNVF